MSLDKSYHQPNGFEAAIKSGVLAVLAFPVIYLIIALISSKHIIYQLPENWFEYDINNIALSDYMMVITTDIINAFGLRLSSFLNWTEFDSDISAYEHLSNLFTHQWIFIIQEVFLITLVIITSYYLFKGMYRHFMISENQLTGIIFTRDEQLASKTFQQNEQEIYYLQELKNQFKIKLADIAISAERLSKHFSILGGTGSGKTVLLRAFIESACSSPFSRAIIFDNKGDVTSTLLNNRKRRPVIIGPYDRRSHVPDIAFDCATRAEAFEFGLVLFPEKQREEIWDKGSRLMLTGVIISLQNHYKTNWGWGTLKTELTHCLSDPQYFHQILLDNFPESAGLIQFDEQGTANETTQSLLISINAEMRSIIELADAYENNTNPKFSIKKFIYNKKQHPQDKAINNVVILQGNTAMQKLQDTSIHFFLGYFIKLVSSPSYPERPPYQDPIHLILDEFPQIGAMLFFKRVLEVCRSKNIPTVFSAQSYAQFTESYKEVTKIIFENCGTRIVARSTDSTAKWFIDAAGRGKFERSYYERDKNNEIRRGLPKTETDDIVRIEDLSTELGTFKENGQPKGVKFLLWAVDQQIYRLKTYFPPKRPQKIRQPFIAAPWCQDAIWKAYEYKEKEQSNLEIKNEK